MSMPLSFRRLMVPAILCCASPGLYAQVNTAPTLLATGGVDVANTATRLTGSFGQPIIGPVVALHGNLVQGFWNFRKPLPSSAEQPVAGETPPSLQCLPNPANNEVTVQALLKKPGRTTLALYDVAGRRVITLMEGMSAEGPRIFHVNTQQLASGAYTLLLGTEENRTVLPILIVR